MSDDLTRIPCVIGGQTEPDDWTIVYDGHEIGRINRTPGRDGATVWIWGINMRPGFASGRASSFDEAKAAFKFEWDKLSDYAKNLAKGRPVRSGDAIG